MKTLIVLCFAIVLGTVAQAQRRSYFDRSQQSYQPNNSRVVYPPQRSYSNQRYNRSSQYFTRDYGNYGNGYGSQYGYANASVGLNSNFTGYNSPYYGQAYYDNGYNYQYQNNGMVPYWIDYYDDQGYYRQECCYRRPYEVVPVGLILVVGTTNHYCYRHHYRYY